MIIDDILLDEKMQSLTEQRDRHLAVYNQAVGALALCQHLKTVLKEKDHLTTDELGKALGGTVESIDPVGVNA